MDGTFRRWLATPEDGASVAVFRIGFGLLAAIAAVRFVAKGWVDTLLLAPAFHFAWVPWAVVPSPVVTYALFVVQTLAGLCVASGRLVRPALAAWLLTFGYVELLDKTLYLNHYVLFTMLGATLLLAPVGRGVREVPDVPRWLLTLLRLEVALVYLWAGVCKLDADWLVRGEPLGTWLRAYADTPVVGPWVAAHTTAVIMSRAGAVYDLTVPFLLLVPRTRALGTVLVLGFHAAVGALFPIGMFPVLMVLGVTLLWHPSWPRRWMVPRGTPAPPVAMSRPMAGAWVLMVGVLALWPARHLAYGDDVNWTERGYRFAWRVLLIEKTGMVEYRVVDRGDGRVWRVVPSAELTPMQHQQMRTQPDMIRDYALHLQRAHADVGRDVAVYADAWASLNGRPAQRLIREGTDLTRPIDELDRLGWIVPLGELAPQQRSRVSSP